MEKSFFQRAAEKRESNGGVEIGAMSNLVPAEVIANKIFLIRGQKVKVEGKSATNCERLALLRHSFFLITGGYYGV